jgi:hypothetical protein
MKHSKYQFGDRKSPETAKEQEGKRKRKKPVNNHAEAPA